MKKHTIIPNLLQKIVSEEELQVIMELVGYRDTTRKFDVRTLIHFFVMAAANEWKSFRHGADLAASYELPKIDHSTVANKAKDVPYEVMKRLFSLIVSKYNRKTRRSLGFPKSLRIVDLPP
jgi:hypothetical protein